MTDGHRHRVFRVKEKSLLLRALRHPLYWVCDPEQLPRIERSPYPYGEQVRYLDGKPRTCWYLSALAILHRWTGLTLETKAEAKR